MTDQPKPLKYSLESLPELLGEHDFRLLVQAIRNGAGDEDILHLLTNDADKGKNFHTLVRVVAGDRLKVEID